MISTLSLLVLFALGEPAPQASVTPSQQTFKGQVTCSVCWDEADRTKVPYGSKADMKCALTCSKKGVPAALAVTTNGVTELLVLEEGTFRKGKKGWMPLMAKKVEVAGTLRQDGKKQIVKVDTLTVLK